MFEKLAKAEEDELAEREAAKKAADELNDILGIKKTSMVADDF